MSCDIEMKTLREDVEKRIEAKMDAIQSARADALDALKGVVAEAEVGFTFRGWSRSDSVHSSL